MVGSNDYEKQQLLYRTLENILTLSYRIHLPWDCKTTITEYFIIIE